MLKRRAYLYDIVTFEWKDNNYGNSSIIGNFGNFDYSERTEDEMIDSDTTHGATKHRHYFYSSLYFIQSIV